MSVCLHRTVQHSQMSACLFTQNRVAQSNVCLLVYTEPCNSQMSACLFTQNRAVQSYVYLLVSCSTVKCLFVYLELCSTVKCLFACLLRTVQHSQMSVCLFTQNHATQSNVYLLVYTEPCSTVKCLNYGIVDLDTCKCNCQGLWTGDSCGKS